MLVRNCKSPRSATPLLIAITMLIAVLIAIAPACRPIESRVATGRVMTVPPTLDELESATYVGITNVPITLVDGKWQGEPLVAGGASRPTVGLVGDFRVEGDLDGDGVAEVVVILWTSSGGSGTFDYIAALGRDENGTVINRASAALGDRVKIRSAQIVDGRIVLDVVEAGPADPFCCPGHKLRRSYALAQGRLREVSSEDLGRLSIADLAGVEWVLTDFDRNELDRNEKLPANVEITLQFDGDRIGGKSACNRYNGGVVEGEIPGELTVNMPLATTRMACPPPVDEIERRYLNALQHLRRYTFVAGSLVLTCNENEERSTLTFAAYEPAQ